ncbi:MAG: sensor histidine kinase [Rhizonema sp. PD38]|nr:sensor histidine kinase [Rhizonema sp. PD38]
MANLRQASFRRILVSKILLLSVPVVLIGEMVAFDKARSSLLETAYQNLTESAANNGQRILDTIAALKTNLLSASETKTIQSGSRDEVQQFLNRLARQLPRQIECSQLTDLETGNIVATTCGDQPIGDPTSPYLSDGIEVEAILPTNAGITGEIYTRNQLRLRLSAPVYDEDGKLHYVLSFRSALLHEKLDKKPGMLTGSTMVIAEDGTILAHPFPSRIGTHIQQQPDASQLKKIVRNALAGQQDYFFFEENEQKLLAGYNAIDGLTTKGKPQKWVIVAVTSVDNALYSLRDMKLVFILLTVILIGASLLASLSVAHYLARPVEKLRDYALNLHLNQAAEPVPDNFNIREFNQLAQALSQMLERLRIWAEELELAWKDAKSANQVKSQFLAATSHELRNPLNIIINCVRLVRDGMCDTREEEMEFLKLADETAIHLLGIINDLLDISKIEAGKLSVSLETIELQKLLKEIINLQSVSVQQKGLKLNISLMNEHLFVHADAMKLKQVIINVVSNATKFTESGSITIHTEIKQKDDQAWASITVKDTGVGIDPTQQQKLFRPYVMVEETANKFGGTGLGLAISRNLIELMNGTITLESAGVNQGTTVTITLPLIDAALLPTSEMRDSKDIEMISANREVIGVKSSFQSPLRQEVLGCVGKGRTRAGDEKQLHK